jgi:hypothetical protein
MAIVAGDIQKRYSVAAAAGDTTAGAAATSLGDQVSTTQIPDAQVANLFGDVDGVEAAAGSTKYRCLFILNNHATLTLTGATVAVQSETAGGATIDIAVDNIAVSAKGAATAQADAIANELTAPDDISSWGDGPIALGDIGPGQVKAVWVRRTVPAGATAVNPDGFLLRVTGNTLP